MVRIVFVVLALWAWSANAARGDHTTASLTATGTCAVPSATQAVVINTAKAGSVGIELTGTWTATVAFRGSMDGTNWFAIRAHDTISGIASASTTSTGQFRLHSAGVHYVCVYASAYTSGTIGVSAVPTDAPHGSLALISDGVNIREQRSGAGGNMTSATTSNNSAMTVPAGEWYVTHTPAAATQASASKSAGGGNVRHVARSITACISAVNAQGDITINLRDGATGAGTVMWTCRLAAAAGTSACCPSPSMAVIGTANTAMTLETSAAPAAGNFASVTLTGFSAN